MRTSTARQSSRSPESRGVSGSPSMAGLYLKILMLKFFSSDPVCQ